MSDEIEREDHGLFTFGVPHESLLVLQLQQQARDNPQRPGHAWGRLTGKREVDGREERVLKVFHVDLERQRLTVTEERDGVETARKTIDLAALHATPTDDSTPPNAPDPGPAEATFERLPFHAAELLPEDELRNWLCSEAEDEVKGASVLRRRLFLFGDGFQEIATLPEAFAAGIAPGTAATLAAISRRPGVERRFVQGWLDGTDGAGTAFVAERLEDGGYWLAVRPFRRRLGMMGTWTADWSAREGTDLAEVPAELRPALVPAAGEVALELGTPKPPDAPSLGMTGGPLADGEVPPSTAEAVAARVARDWEPKVPAGEAIDGARIVVFRGREWETWEVEADPPMGLDDLIRAICARGEEPASLAVVRWSIITLEGQSVRALLTTGEAAGRRFTRALCVQLAPDNTPTRYRLAGSDHGVVGDDGWIGVPPITEMSLYIPGAAEA
jgi:hypothetical protein